MNNPLVRRVLTVALIGVVSPACNSSIVNDYPSGPPGDLAFTSAAHGTNDIYLMEADGRDPRRLTSNLSDDYWSSWSPDGRRSPPIGMVTGSHTCCHCFTTSEINLVQSDRDPVNVGWNAPDVVGESWPTADSATVSHDSTHVTLLVFCHQACQGCRALRPLLSQLRQRFGNHDRVRLVSVVTSTAEAEAVDSLVATGFAQIVPLPGGVHSP